MLPAQPTAELDRPVRLAISASVNLPSMASSSGVQLGSIIAGMPASRLYALMESLLRPSLAATFSSVRIGVRTWPVSVRDAPPLPVFKRRSCRSAFWDSLFVVVLGATVTRTTVILMGHRTHD